MEDIDDTNSLDKSKKITTINLYTLILCFTDDHLTKQSTF